jgi:predicted MPP superfamily phosphohydrolase
MPIAASMILGGFLGRGFLRSWCVGCLAILVWYERLRAERNAPVPRSLLEIGTTQPLLVRRTPLRIFGYAEPVRLLYASDLHCGGGHSRRAVEQLVCAAREHSPDLILLGGDLADAKGGLPLLTETVAVLCACAPVWAIAGNHDERTGLRDVIAAISRGGGDWLGGRSILWRSARREPFYLDGVIPGSISSGHKRILCAHDPAIFPRAAALEYPLVLAGHLHGGQFVCSERRGRLLPGAWFYRWNGLRFEKGRSTMLVSRGVADTLPVRWNCPREILLCELY